MSGVCVIELLLNERVGGRPDAQRDCSQANAKPCQRMLRNDAFYHDVSRADSAYRPTESILKSGFAVRLNFCQFERGHATRTSAPLPDVLRFERFFLADEQSLIPRSLVSADRTYKHGSSSATRPPRRSTASALLIATERSGSPQTEFAIDHF
jgi:hypothetical protein